MNHINILKRALNITINYRALWIFGILLALTSGSGSGNGGGRIIVPLPMVTRNLTGKIPSANFHNSHPN